MRTGKKFLAVLLSLTLVFTLAGCSGKKDTTDNNAGTSTVAPTQAAAAATPTEVPATPTPVPDKFAAFDFGGKTITVGTWWDYYYTSDNTSIDDNKAVSNRETAQMQLDNVRRIEQKYNCKIVYKNMTWAGIMSSINTSIAAGTPDCDVYMADLQFGLPAVFNGLAQDLTPNIPANSDMLSASPQIMHSLDTSGLGGTYLFQDVQLPLNGLVMGYNATMIQDLGLEDPQQLYKDGKWTWDKFEELAKAGTKDTNNDGVTDVYGFGSVFTETAAGFLLSNGASLASTPTEGLDSPSAVQTFEFMNKLYNTDFCARPFQSDWNDNWYAWSQGKVMFWTGQPWIFSDAATKAVAAGAEIPFDYHVVPFPKGPSATDDTPRSIVTGNWYFIPTGEKENVSQILTIMEEYFGWHKGDPEYRDDPTWLQGCFLSQDDVDIAVKCGSTLVFDPWQSLDPYFNFGSVIIGPVINDKSQTVAQAVEAGKGTLQNALDSYVFKNVKK